MIRKLTQSNVEISPPLLADLYSTQTSGDLLTEAISSWIDPITEVK